MSFFDKPDTIKLIFKLSPGMAGGKYINIGYPYNLSVMPEEVNDYEESLAHALVASCPNFQYVNPKDAEKAPKKEEEIEEVTGYAPSPSQKGCKTC